MFRMTASSRCAALGPRSCTPSARTSAEWRHRCGWGGAPVGGGVGRAAELHTVTALQQERSGRERDCRLCPVRLALSCNNTGYRAIGSMTEEAIELTPSLQHGSPFPPLSPTPPPHAGGHQAHHAAVCAGAGDTDLQRDHGNHECTGAVTPRECSGAVTPPALYYVDCRGREHL